MDLMRAQDTEIKSFDLNSEHHVGRKAATEPLIPFPRKSVAGTGKGVRRRE